MRKTILLSTAALVCATTLMAQSDGLARDTIVADWATAFGSKGADTPAQISSNDEGDTYVTFDFASYKAEASRWTAFGMDTVRGFPSGATNGNHNFGMYRLDGDGTRQLTVYSDQGYWDKASSGMMATSDGGAILALKMRNADAVTTTNEDGHKYLLRLRTSADPAYEYTITEDTMPQDHGWLYRGYILKLDKDGKVQWKRNVWTDTTPVGAEKRSNMFDFADAVQGPDGCYYIGGTFAAPLYVDGRQEALTPTNIPEGWDYDYTQNPAGDLFVMKLDANGDYCWTLTHDAGSSTKVEKAVEMDVDDAAVYLMGYINGSGNGTDKVSFDGHSISVPSERSHLFYLRIPCADNTSATDGNITVSYAKLLEARSSATVSKPRIQPISIDVEGGLVLLTGAVTGDVYDGDNLALQNTATSLMGYAIAADAATGDYRASFKSDFARSISQAQHATVVGDSVYVLGYDMWSNAGGWLAALDRETLAARTVYSVFRGGNMATTWGGTVVDGNRYLMLGRGRMQSASALFEVTGVGTVGIKGNDWECLAVGFDLPGVDADDPGSGTGIVPTSTPDNSLRMWTAPGCLTVLADEPCQVRVLNVTGAAVATFEAQATATTLQLPQGLYIVNGQKVIIR